MNRRNKQTKLLFLVCICWLLNACTEQTTEEDQLKDWWKRVSGVAFESTDNALAMADSLEDAGIIPHREAELTRAMVYFRADKYRLAEFYARNAAKDKAFEKNKDYSYFMAKMILCRINMNEHTYERALQRAQSAAAPEVKAPLVEKGHAQILIAECLSKLNQWEQAEAQWKEAIALMEKETKNSKTSSEVERLLHGNLSFLMGCFLHGDTKKALSILPALNAAEKQLLDCPDLQPAVARRYQSNVAIAKALVYAKGGMQKEAEQQYLQSQQPDGTPDMGTLIQSVDYLILTNRNQEALLCIGRLDSIYKANGEQYSEAYVEECLKPKCEALTELGHPNEAFEVAKLMNVVADTVRQKTRRANMEQLSTIRKHEADIDQQNKQLFILHIIVFAIVLFLILAGYILLRNSRQHKLIKEKSHALTTQIREAIGYKDAYEDAMKQLQKLRSKTSAPEPGQPSEAIEKEPADLDSMTDTELFNLINHTIVKEKLFLDPDFGRQQLSDRFQLTFHRIGQVFSQGSNYDSLTSYVTELRLAHSCKLLLENPELSIEAVSKQSGYKNAPTFNRNFKSKYSITPTEFRNQSES